MQITRTRLYTFVTIGALLIGAGLRLYHLTADTPNYFAGLGQALMTDPYHITTYARNKVLFGSWEIFDYNRWVAFRVSLVSGFAWLVFMMGGVSRLTANLTSVLLNLGATVLLVSGVYRGFHYTKSNNATENVDSPSLTESKWFSAAIAALGLSFSHVLIVYSREPFLENGLLLIAAVCFFVIVRRERGPWGALSIGALLALAPLAGKLFGLILLAPVFVTVVLSSKNKWKELALIGVGGLVTAILWYLFVLGDDTAAYHTYLQEQSTGLYGFPPGLTSVKFFFIQLFSYGAELRLFQFHLFVPALIVVGYGGLLSLRYGDESPWTLSFWRERPALTFLTVWFICAWLSLMVFQYRPLRYSLFVIFPALGVLGCLVSQIFSAGANWAKSNNKMLKVWQKIFAAALLYLGVATIMTQGWLVFFGSELSGDSVVATVKYSSLIAAPIVIVIWLIMKVLQRPSLSIVRYTILRYTILSLVVCSVVYQGYWYYRMASNLTYDMVTASRDMENALSANAVLTGPYAPNLTIDNSHKNIIYSFGLKYETADLFSRFPITHLAGDYGNLDQADIKFPQTKDKVEVALWTFRDTGVRLLRLGGSFSQMRGLPETAFEKSDRFLKIRTVSSADSAVYYAELFLTKNPTNRAAKRRLFQSLLTQKDYDRALAVGKQLTEENPTDCLAHLSLARAYFYLGHYLKQEKFNVQGEIYLKRSLELNPASEKYLNSVVRNF